MNLYSIDLKVYATAYIKAETEEQALTKVTSLIHEYLEVTSTRHSAVIVSDLDHRDPRLPEISLSPAMTISSALEGTLLEEENLP